ncbi:hypothetical protein QBC37DRAFT_128769 [Rhypophila decipiens]|uniref:Uncharacterized protein n=1 Tax=Rhypophila decipiens TaxID=261697 RepID=A0AAN6YA38_9PEZI|nr:hypothetical protein QBC37DRAFT_128769 [Rhypophila decipiens]
MDRGRGRARAPKKRATLASHSHELSPETEIPTFPTTPIASSTSAASHRAPFTAPQRGGKSKVVFSGQQRPASRSGDSSFRVTPGTDRPARSTTFPSNFTFDSPSLPSGTNMAAGNSSRPKRAKTFEASYDGTADDEAHSKGGHSLRRRARIDYTQEQIDDLTPNAPRPDSSKSTTTPNARSRKRKDSEDDFFDDAAAHAKRRRSENPAPAHAKTSSLRRRSELEPGQTTLSFKVVEDQQSDNEIRDTILVGISMDENVDETEVSELSSPLQEPGSPSTSDGSDNTAAKVQPPTPQPQVIPHVEKAVAVAPESEGIEKGLMVDQQGEAEMQSKDLPLPSLPIQLKADDGVNHVASDSEVKRVESSLEQVVDDQSTEVKNVDEPRAQSPEHTAPEQIVEFKTEAAPLPEPLPASEKDLPTFSALPQTSGSIEATETPEPREAFAPTDESRPAPASPQPSRAGVSSQVRRKGRLETIYSRPTPYGAQLRLTPYESEEVLLPGPYLEKSKLVESSIPTPAPTPSPVERQTPEFVWDPRHPLKQREFFQLYRQEMKKRTEMGLERMSMIEFNNYCVRKYKAANDPNGDPTEYPLISSQKQSRPITTAAPVPLRKLPPLSVSASFDETPQGSQAADSQQPTAAPSPAPIDESVAVEENDQEAKERVDGRTEPGNAAEPVEKLHIPRKQYSFPKIRDPSEFIEALENWQEMDAETLYKTTAAATEALHIWEQEAAELRKIIDDEDNAKRRLPNDKAIENWENRKRPDEPDHWRRHFDESHKGPPPFELKGVRAPRPYIDDPVLERQKENDRIMAQAYGFKYDPHPARVGKQNPEEQRWDSGERGLRDRKKTEKGAELAEENVIEGKRTRKPRNLSDQSKEPSRAATPIGSVALGVGRRAKRKPGAGFIPEDEPNTSKALVEEAPSGSAGKKRRGPRPRAEILAEQEEAAAALPDSVDNRKGEDEDSLVKPAITRKRGPPPTSVPAEHEQPRPNEQRPAKKTSAEIASSSFYSNPSPVNTPLESRPSTASSEATVHTMETSETTYSLRDKRKRNFALENDPELEPRAQKKARAVGASSSQEHVDPKKRAPRKKPTATATATATPMTTPMEPSPVSQPPPASVPQPVGGLKAPEMFFNNPPPVLAPAPGPFIHTFKAAPVPVYQPPTAPPPVPEPPAAKKPIVQIKLKITNNGPTSQGPSRTPTPANIAPNPASKSTAKTSRAPKSSTPVELAPQPAGGTANMLNGDQGELQDKPYAEMSKSEKMSYSMRRRWASGEMKGAVEKRRTTLANKKAEKAAGSPASNSADPSLAGRTPDPSSAGPSAPATPALLPTQSGPLAFPPPSQGFQHLPHMQQPVQQGLQPLHQGLQAIPHGLQQLQHSMPLMPQGLQPPQQPHPQQLQQPMQQPFPALQQPPHLFHQPPLIYSEYSYHPPQGPAN